MTAALALHVSGSDEEPASILARKAMLTNWTQRNKEIAVSLNTSVQYVGWLRNRHAPHTVRRQSP
jgi:hypothetical protein